MNDALAAKYEALKARIGACGRVVVAFSGGVDSSLVARVAAEALGDAALAVTSGSQSLKRSDLALAGELAARWGMRHRVIVTDEVANPRYRANPANRCFYCKTTLYEALARIAADEDADAGTEAEEPSAGEREGPAPRMEGPPAGEREGPAPRKKEPSAGEREGPAPRKRDQRCRILNGTNLDDLGDHRPGLVAAENHDVVSPLVDAGFRKADVRALAAHLGMENASKPQAACLSSRFPYGSRITEARLAQVEAAEDALAELGFGQLRVRHHEDVARLELPAEELPRAVAQREEVERRIKAVGYRYVALDLGGFRSGSLNDALIDVVQVCEPPISAASAAGQAATRGP